MRLKVQDPGWGRAGSPAASLLGVWTAVSSLCPHVRSQAAWGLPRSKRGLGPAQGVAGAGSHICSSHLILICFHGPSQLPGGSGRPQRAAGRGCSDTPRTGQLPYPAFGKGGGHEERITGNHPWPSSLWEAGSDAHTHHFPALSSPPLLTTPVCGLRGRRVHICVQLFPGNLPRPGPSFPQSCGMRSSSED